MSKLCLIYNTAPRYREAIFQAIDKEYDCDWFFGETKTDIKEMDLSLLKHTCYYKYYGNPSKIYWKCILSLLFRKKYKTYLMLSESRALSDYFFFGLKNILFPKKKIYVWTHGWYGKESKLESKLKLWQFRHVDGIFVYGDYARQLLIEKGIPKHKLFTIHNSLHYDQQRYLRERIHNTPIYQEHFDNSNPNLIFVGRLTKVKQLDMILRAMSNLKKQGQEYNLILIGDGDMRKELETLAAELNLTDQVWFYGACYDESVLGKLIYNADLCVSPGNVGLTAVHSMVFGTPVITHNDFPHQMPEFEAIHDGETGTFFSRGDVQSLADGIKRWFDEKGQSREQVRQACFSEIDTQWTPYFQIDVIKKVINEK